MQCRATHIPRGKKKAVQCRKKATHRGCHRAEMPGGKLHDWAKKSRKKA